MLIPLFHPLENEIGWDKYVRLLKAVPSACVPFNDSFSMDLSLIYSLCSSLEEELRLLVESAARSVMFREPLSYD